jgi:hypothetical protein
MQTENTAIRKDEEDGNKLEDGMNHSDLTTKTSPGTPISGQNGCVNPDADVINWNDNAVSNCHSDGVGAGSGSKSRKHLSCNLHMVTTIPFSLGNDRLAIEQGLCISGRRPTSCPRDLSSQQQDEVGRETQVSYILLKPPSVCSCEKSACDFFLLDFVVFI